MSKNNTTANSTTGTPQPSDGQPIMGDDEMDLENLNVQGLKRPGEEFSRKMKLKVTYEWFHDPKSSGGGKSKEFVNDYFG